MMTMKKMTKLEMTKRMRKSKEDIAYFRERWYDTVSAIVSDPYMYRRDDILDTLKQLLKEIEQLPSTGE